MAFTPARDSSHQPEVVSPTFHEGDLELVRAVLGGSAEARDAFCDRLRCVGRILATRNADLGRPLDDHDLADLVQDTVLAVWRRLETFEGRASLETWVYRYCTLGLAHALRRRRARTERSSAQPEAASAGGVWLDAPPQEPELEAMLRHLSPREAQVLRLRHVDGLSNQEIGEVIDISINSVKTHSLHGMRKLRSLMADRGER